MNKLTCLLVAVLVILTLSKATSASNEFSCSEVFLGMKEEKLIHIFDKYNIKYEVIDRNILKSADGKKLEITKYRIMSLPDKVISGTAIINGESGALYEFGISKDDTVSMIYCTYYAAI
ncbi:hypothetical protein K1W69_20325 [Hoeflea sp. WL0058]|uniref:Uncharacterized protein n=1 Tax=Flavimaribacter sediminis TaxID=2865987 RepID=A0AAE2ZRI9_9HYPH|nr:hypothetical protein [Flavimaribacter sediminis]MBW8639550.1 hypothetical protein [Flavimaribacter sediminis]